MFRQIAAMVAITVSLTLTAPAQSPFLQPDSDAVLSQRVSAALAADPDLAPLTLSVDVINKVAIVGGPVPDRRLIARIEQTLETVPGLETARVSGWVPATADPLASRVGELLRGETRPPAPPPAARPPVVRTSAELPPLILMPHPDPAPQPLPRSAVVPPLVRIETPWLPTPAPPTFAPEPPPATVTRYTTPTRPGWLEPPVAPAEGLPALLGQVRTRDSRFARLTTTLDHGVVTVSGRVPAHADTWEFVAVVRKLPGVLRVVVGSIGADS